MYKLRTRRALRFEGCSANEEFVRKDTKGPVVDALRMRFTFDHFRRQIVKSPTECGPAESRHEQGGEFKEQQITYRLPGA